MGQVSGEWDSRRLADVEDWMGKCLESGTNNRRSADVEYWMGQVSGEWDEQQKVG